VARRIHLSAVWVPCIAAAVYAGLADSARAQSPSSAAPSFEVSSIKRNQHGGPIAITSQPGGRFIVNNAPVADMIAIAYQLQRYQIVGQPGWVDTDRYDVIASGDPSSPPLAGPGNPISPMQLMLRTLLADRFQMTSHLETREMPIYELVIARSDGHLGKRLERMSIDCSGPRAGGPPLPRAGERPPCRLFVTPTSMAAGGVTLSQLAAVLGAQVGRQVVDRTGLTGLFGFNLEFRAEPFAAVGAAPPGPLPSPNADAPSLFTALEEQLGLKLQPRRGPVSVLVIDRLERPQEN
jgi:uncharacterized protein (TIGR03435 family)